MAVLNVSFCSSTLPPNPKPPLSFHKPLLLSETPQSSDSSLCYRTPQGLNQIGPPQNPILSLGESVAKASFLALISASLCFADPALAFKGGGPYGAGVTRGQDLTGKDFSGKSLIKQDFKTSILRQANFKGAKLLGASFFDADLTAWTHENGRSGVGSILHLRPPRADLSDADLRGADFSLANVTKANLSNANLEGALATGNTSFKGSVITGADFTDVPLRDDQRQYLCKIADGVNPTTGNDTRETLLCS